MSIPAMTHSTISRAGVDQVDLSEVIGYKQAMMGTTARAEAKKKMGTTC